MEENHNLDVYYSALESYEEFNNLLCTNDKSLILFNLMNCREKIKNIIQTETTTEFMKPLTQLLIDCNTLLNHVQKTLNNTNKTPIKEQNNQVINPPSSSSNSNKLSDNNKYKQIVESTIQPPKILGLHEICGLEQIKKTLRSLIIVPKQQPQLFDGRPCCNSALLFGPPGTGKTWLAHGIAAEAKSLLFSISVSDIVSPYIGDAEKTIKTLFHHVRNCKNHCIVFLDEIDGICRKRSIEEQEHTRRIKTELMCQLSAIENCRNIFLICATNCPWELDSAILRRFHKKMYVPLPNHQERMEFFQKYVQNIEHTPIWEYLLSKTEKYSFSDLSDIIQNAFDIPVMELQDNFCWVLDNGIYRPSSNDETDSNIKKIYLNLCDLPPNSVQARKLKIDDLIKASDDTQRTISGDDLERFVVFSGNKL